MVMFTVKGTIYKLYLRNLSFVKELMADLIKILPGADFWAGGPEVSYDAEKFLTENSEFKGVMVGEGEETFKELAGYLWKKIRRI